MTHCRLRAGLGAGLLCILLAPPAHAQRGIDANRFWPALDGSGLVTVDGAQTPSGGDFGFQIVADYAHAPLRLAFSDDQGGVNRSVVMDHLFVIHLGAHVGLTRWLEAVVDVPVAQVGYTGVFGSPGSAADSPPKRTGFYAADPYTNVGPPDASPLDTRLGLKARLVDTGGFALAVFAVATLPFGDDAAFLGDSSFTFRPRLAASLDRGGLRLALDVGANLRETTTVLDPREVAAGVAAPRALLTIGHELTWAAGASYRPWQYVGFALELFGLVPIGGSPDYVADALGSIEIFPTSDLTMRVGGGTGLIPDASRTADFRAFLQIGWAPREVRR